MDRRDYLSVKETIAYVQDRHARHWSRSYLYLLMDQNRLPKMKIGVARIFTKDDIDFCVKRMTKPSPKYPKKGGDNDNGS